MGAPMSKRNGHFVGLVAAVVLSSAVAGTASADQYSEQVMGEDHVSGAAVIMDALIARPVLFVSTLAGSALFVAASPFALAGGNIKSTWNTLVMTPAEQTFSRCLGCTPVQHERARADRQTELANMPRE